MDKPKMTHEVRKKVKTLIKNRIDISDIIEKYSIRGEDLSGAIISRFVRTDENMSCCNLSRAIIGDDNLISNFNRANARNCNFKGSVWKGRVLARRIDARGSNFNGAIMPHVDYRYADLRNCNFCDTVFCIGTERGYGAIFS